MSNDPTDKEDVNFKSKIIEDIRPWGKFRSFPFRKVSSVKIITVNPEESLSLQFHNNRSEFWVILDNGLEITVGQKIWRPQKNEEIYIPEKAIHRVRNLSQRPARIFELWLGSSDESDIFRLEDNYGR